MRTKNHSWNPSACIFENDKYLKCTVDTLVSVYNKIKIAKTNISTNVTNAIPTSMTNKNQKMSQAICQEIPMVKK